MKQILPLIALFISTSVFSQATFDVKPPVVDTFFTEADFDPVGKAKVCFSGADSIILLWKIKDIKTGFNWESYVCDNNFCYGSDTRECPIVDPNIIYSGECGTMDVHLFQGAVVVPGIYRIIIWEMGNPDNVDSIQYNFNNPVMSTSSVRDAQAIQIFPNPTSSRFELSDAMGVSRISISDILGKEVKQFDNVREGNSYSVADLGSGIYVVNLFDEANQLVKSSRLRKK